MLVTNCTTASACAAAVLVQEVYSSAGCSGDMQSQSAPVGLCMKDTQGTYFTNLCGDDAASSSWEYYANAPHTASILAIPP